MVLSIREIAAGARVMDICRPNADDINIHGVLVKCHLYTHDAKDLP